MTVPTNGSRVTPRIGSVARAIALAAAVGAVLLACSSQPTAAKSSAELERLRAEAMYRFVPPQSSVEQTNDNPAKDQVPFGGATGDTNAGHVFRVAPQTVAASMDAFIEPATRDGWQVTNKSCDRALGELKLDFRKVTPVNEMALRVRASSKLNPGAITAYLTLGADSGPPGTGVGSQAVPDLNCTDT